MTVSKVLNGRETKKLVMVKACGEPRGILHNVALVRKVSRD